MLVYPNIRNRNNPVIAHAQGCIHGRYYSLLTPISIYKSSWLVRVTPNYYNYLLAPLTEVVG